MKDGQPGPHLGGSGPVFREMEMQSPDYSLGSKMRARQGSLKEAWRAVSSWKASWKKWPLS